MFQKIDISIGIIFRTILILLALGFLYVVRDVIVLLFISVIIVAAIEPAVNWFQKKRIPRTVGVLILYVLLFLLIGLAISLLASPIASQLQDFSKGFPKYFQGIENSFGPIRDFFQTNNANPSFQNFLNDFSGVLSNLPRKIFSGTVGVFSGFISVIVVFSMAFYMAAEKDSLKKFIVSVTPLKHQEYAADLVARIKNKMGKWMLGQVFLMLIVGVIDFIGLYLVGVPYPLILAIFAGILEIIPYVGPIVAAIPGIILGFLISPTVGFLAFLVYLITQQIEGHVIVPLVMKKAVGLNPVVVILVLLAGAKLAGVLGAIIAIPVATAAGLFISDMMNKNETAGSKN